MIQLYDANISDCFVHFVGNKANDDGVRIATKRLSIDEITKKSLSDYFYRSFIEKDDYYAFAHQTNVELNTIYSYVVSIFDDKEQIVEISANIAKYLYEQSLHPKIKCGELYIAYIENCIVDGIYVDAIGIFKSETKDTFLRISPIQEGFSIESEKGVNIKKLDKGCLIFNMERESGYVVAVVDNTNKGVEAQYWVDDFLHVRSRKDEYSNTRNVMAMAKTFVTKELPKEFEVSKKEQISLLNKLLQFFKENETFDMDAFTHEVISQPEVIERFHRFKQNYEETNDMVIDSQFAISDSALKKQQRSYKRTIRLDKKIQIIIDGNSDHVEQGRDERGKFYKVYYSEED